MTDRVYPNTASPPLRGAYYNMKDQPLPQPATYRSEGRRRRGPCCCICATLCGILWTLIFAIGIAALIIWLVVRPKIPKYDVQNVRVTGLTTNTSQSLNPRVSFDVIARNRNGKVGIYYDNIYVYTQTGDVQLGSGTIPGFYQGHKNTTTIPANLTGSVAANRLTRINLQRLPLYVRADTKIRLKIGALKTARVRVKVRCNMNLALSTSGSATVSDKKCKVDT